jgi:hypothetical protein
MSRRRFHFLAPVPAMLWLACGSGTPDSTTAPHAIAEGAPVTAGSSVAPAVEGVTVAGRVVDDETGEGLAGGYVIVLAPGVSFGEWERSPDGDIESLMAGAALTDSMGRYEVPALARGMDFTVVIAARGHAPAVFEGGLTVRPDDPALTRLADVRLERR